MNRDKKNKLCAAIHNTAANLIEHAALLRHYEESQAWAKSMLIDYLREIVAAAAFFGVTTNNVKDEKERLIKWFSDKT